MMNFNENKYSDDICKYEHFSQRASESTRRETLRRRKAILFILILFCHAALFSQVKRGNVWVTGHNGSKINFNTPTISTSANNFPLKYFSAGNSCISDTNGNLILASDGFNIYDSTGQWLLDGDTIVPTAYYLAKNGHSINSQTSIFLPKDSNQYYFITSSFSDSQHIDCITNNNCYHDLLLYNVIDMNANGGMGKVVQRMVPACSSAHFRKTQMIPCRHGNGKDWWLLKNEGDYGDVHTFLFTQDNVFDKGIQMFNQPNWGPWDIRGQSTFNSDGSRFATTSHGSCTGLVFLADFDRCHGVLSNPSVLQMPWGSQQMPWDTTLQERLSTGLCFSPNGNFLYVISNWNIYQYDLLDNSWFHVSGIDTSAEAFMQYETAYKGPDNKIYVGNFHGLSKQMSRIDNPDVKGAGCNFCPRCLRLDSIAGVFSVGTPPCMPDYGLGAKTCWPLESQQYAVGSEQLEVYPNPSSAVFIIKNKHGKNKELYTVLGELLFSTKEDVINVSHFASGIYYLRCENEVVKLIIE